MKLFIIAEAGINHNGEISLAKELIKVAKLSGANAVKFQAAIPNLVCTSKSPLAKYQKTNNSETQLNLLSKIHLPLEAYKDLNQYAKELGIEFMCSAFDNFSLDYINNLGVKYHKIASGEINHYPFLKQIANYNKPTIVSTGMATLKEIKECLEVLTSNGLSKRNIILMHCTTDYPTNFEDVNLNAIKTISNNFNYPIGYSDHTIGNEVSIAALGMGCNYFEKHFTLDKNMIGPDHKASLSIKELSIYVNSLKNIYSSLGNGEKKPSQNEITNKKIVRRSIVAKIKIKKGDSFTEENIICKRPAKGINPMKWEEVIGKKAIKDFDVDDLIIYK